MGQDALSAVSDGRHASSGQEERHVGRDHGREEATDMPQRRAAALLLPQSGREKMMGTFKKEAEDHLGALPRVSLERALRWSDLPKACLPLTWGLVQLSGSGLMTGCLGCLTCPTPIRRGAAVSRLQLHSAGASQTLSPRVWLRSAAFTGSRSTRPLANVPVYKIVCNLTEF
jgi:hypothetical protein